MVDAPYIRLVLWKAAKAVEKVDKASIYTTGLHLSDFQIMEILLHKGPLPVNAIGEKVLLTSGSMTAAAKRLEKKGLVQRIQNPLDGRCFNIHLTAGGKTVIKRAYTDHEKNLEKVVSVLTSTERSELVRLLKKIGFNAERLNQAS
jgi:MarR family transcriptional regulator, 2-MHQ and catechol-resistance regulon repressor